MGDIKLKKHIKLVIIKLVFMIFSSYDTIYTMITRPLIRSNIKISPTTFGFYNTPEFMNNTSSTAYNPQFILSNQQTQSYHRTPTINTPFQNNQKSNNTTNEKKSTFSSTDFFNAGLAALALQALNVQNEEDLDELINIGPLINSDETYIQSYPNLALFFKKYRCSSDIERFLKNKDFTSESHPRNKVDISFVLGKLEDQNLALYIKQSKIDRIINQERLRSYLKATGLNYKFKVVNECLSCLNDHIFTVISPKVTASSVDKRLSLKELKDLIKIMLDTNFVDWQIGDNIIQDQNDNIVFVDTEDRSFNAKFLYDKKNLVEWQLKTIISRDLEKFDEQAQAWIKIQFDILNNPEGWMSRIFNLKGFRSSDFWHPHELQYQNLVNNFYENITYDTDLNFEQVKIELELLRKKQNDKAKQDEKLDKQTMLHQRKLMLTNQ